MAALAVATSVSLEATTAVTLASNSRLVRVSADQLTTEVGHVLLQADSVPFNWRQACLDLSLGKSLNFFPEYSGDIGHEREDSLGLVVIDLYWWALVSARLYKHLRSGEGRFPDR